MAEMTCPECRSTGSSVTDTRPVPDYNAIRRRRHCSMCANRWTTYETSQDPRYFDVVVKKIKALASVMKPLKP